MTKRATPTVSVVIPTHNRLATLADAVNSVLAQGEFVHQLVVVDDGSTDGTADYLAELAADRRVTIVRHDTALGASAARNAGMLVASGDLIAFQDSDDIWLPGKLAKDLAAFEADSSLGFLSSHFIRLSERGAEFLPTRLTEADLTPTVCAANSLVSTQTLVGRAGVLRAVPFDESLRRFVDWEHSVRLAQIAKGRLMPYVSALTRVQGDSLSTDQAAGARSRAVMLGRFNQQLASMKTAPRLRLQLKAAVAIGLYLPAAEDAALVNELAATRTGRWVPTVARLVRSRWVHTVLKPVVSRAKVGQVKP